MILDIEIDQPVKIEANVEIGVEPTRPFNKCTLKIGPNAHIRSGTTIYHSSQIGKSFETGHNVVVRENVTIGDNVKIWNSSTVDYDCILGNNVKVHCNVYIAQKTVIGNNVFIGPGVLFLNDKIPECNKCLEAPIIEDGVRIGAGALIMPGIRVKKNALIGAGSVITKDVEENQMVYGNPARSVGYAKTHECKHHA